MVLRALHSRQEDGSSAGTAHLCAVSPGYSTAAVQERNRQIPSALGGCLPAHPAWPCSTSLGAAHPSH